MRFSQRMGITPVSDVIQVDSMNADLRNGLWNVLLVERLKEEFLDYNEYDDELGTSTFGIALWSNYFKQPIDELQISNEEILEKVRDYFFKCAWYEVYDFIEFCAAYYDDRPMLIDQLNTILQRELAGFRIIGGRIAPISSPQEVETIQSAIDDVTFPGVCTHLKTALDLLSRNTNPDYRNSIKESISAVESICCSIAKRPSATLGDAIKELARSHSLHGALKEGFQKLYGYTSDGDGIRHAMLDESKLTQADAVYFLVSCSAFVNYLKSKVTELSG